MSKIEAQNAIHEAAKIQGVNESIMRNRIHSLYSAGYTTYEIANMANVAEVVIVTFLGIEK